MYSDSDHVSAIAGNVNLYVSRAPLIPGENGPINSSLAVSASRAAGPAMPWKAAGGTVFGRDSLSSCIRYVREESVIAAPRLIGMRTRLDIASEVLGHSEMASLTSLNTYSLERCKWCDVNLILLKYEQLVRDCKNNVRLSVFTACEKENPLLFAHVFVFRLSWDIHWLFCRVHY